jgi:hypothetical protein
MFNLFKYIVMNGKVVVFLGCYCITLSQQIKSKQTTLHTIY